MQYKTIVLKLFQEHPALRDRLTASNSWLLAMNQLAIVLREKHLTLLEEVMRLQPTVSDQQLRSETLELAIQNLLQLLPNDQTASEPESLSLDDAIAFIRRPSPQN